MKDTISKIGRAGRGIQTSAWLGSFLLCLALPLPAAPPEERGLVNQIKAVASGKEAFSRSHQLVSLVQRLSAEERMILLDDISRQPESEERGELRRLLYLRWVEVEPAKALGHFYQEFRSGDHGEAHRALMEKLIEQWARQDLEAAKKHVERLELREIAGLKDVLQTRIALVWAETDALAATQWFQERTCGKAEGVGLSRIVGQVAADDPAAAVGLLEMIPEGFAANLAVEGLMSGWVEKDLSAARKWAETLPDGRRRRTAFFICVHHWLKEDAPAAGEYLLKRFPETDLRKELIREFAYEWAHRDPAAVLEWRHKVSDEALRATILSDVRIVWCDTDPPGAARHAMSLADEEGKVSMLTRCGMAWGEKDHEAALDFAESHKNDPCHPVFMGGLIEGLALRDPAQAAKLFDRFARSRSPDVRLADAIIQSWSGYDPEATGAWILTLPDYLKHRCLSVLMGSWSAEEPEEAQAWRQSNGL